jgi:hypothetical protein
VRVSTITVTFRAEEVAALLSLCASIQRRPSDLPPATVHDAAHAILRLAGVERDDPDPQDAQAIHMPIWVCQCLVRSRFDEMLTARRRAEAATPVGSGASRPKPSHQRTTRAQLAQSTAAVSGVDGAADVAAAGQHTAAVADPSGACQSDVVPPETVDGQ